MSNAQDDLQAAFLKACEDSKKLTSKPNNEHLLEMYSLYKVANNEDFSKVPKPGMFDMKNNAKWKAWQRLVEEQLSAENAQKRYVELIDKMKEEYGYDENKVPETVNSDK